MEVQQKNRVCAGCGALLQSDDPSAPGYVPELVTNRKGATLCRRCFRLVHYGALEPVVLTSDTYLEQVKSSIERATGLLVMVDIVDFEGSLDDTLLKLCRMKPFIVLVNKMDLLPKVVPQAEVEDWVYQRFEAKGLIPESCIGISSVKFTKSAMKKLWEEISEVLGGQVAVIGVTNVGKSSFLNAALKLQGRSTAECPTVSDVAGTTLGVLKYRFDDYDLTLMDTPGLVPEGRLSDLMCDACQRALVPHKPLTSRLVELLPQQSVLLSRYCQIDVMNTIGAEKRALIGVYVPESVKVHKTHTEKANVLRLSEESKLFDKPCRRCTRELIVGEWESKPLELRPGQDLAISGLGWITIRRVGVRVLVHLPKHVKIEKRMNLVGRKDWT